MGRPRVSGNQAQRARDYGYGNGLLHVSPAFECSMIHI
jgi:hypothetical protein